MPPLLYIAARFVLLAAIFAGSAWAYLRLHGGQRRAPGYAAWLLGAGGACLACFALEFTFAWKTRPAAWQLVWGHPVWNFLALPCALAPAIHAWRRFQAGPARRFRERELASLSFRPGPDGRADYDQLNEWQRELEGFQAYAPFIHRHRRTAALAALAEHQRKLATHYNWAMAAEAARSGHPADALKRVLQIAPQSREAVLLSMDIPAACATALDILSTTPAAGLGLGPRQHESLRLEAAQLLAEEKWSDHALRARALESLDDHAGRRRKAFLFHRHGDMAQSNELLRDDPTARQLLNEPE